MKTPAELREWANSVRDKRNGILRAKILSAFELINSCGIDTRYWAVKRYIKLSGSTNASIELAKMRVSNVRSRISLNKEIWS